MSSPGSISRESIYLRGDLVYTPDHTQSHGWTVQQQELGAETNPVLQASAVSAYARYPLMPQAQYLVATAQQTSDMSPISTPSSPGSGFPEEGALSRWGHLAALSAGCTEPH